MEGIERRVQVESTLEISTGSFAIVRGFGDHASVIVKPSVTGGEAERLLDRVFGFAEFAGFKGSPGEGIGAVDVAAVAILASGVAIGFGCISIVVGFKDCDLAVISGPVEGAEMPDLFHERVLGFGVLGSVGELV